MPTFERISTNNQGFQEPPSNKFKQFLQNFQQLPKYFNTSKPSSIPSNNYPRNGVLCPQSTCCSRNNISTNVRNDIFYNNTDSCLIRDPFHCRYLNGNVSCNVNEPLDSVHGIVQCPCYISSIQDEEDKLISRLNAMRPNLGRIRSGQPDRDQNRSELTIPLTNAVNSIKCSRQPKVENHRHVKQPPNLKSNPSIIQNKIINKCTDHCHPNTSNFKPPHPSSQPPAQYPSCNNNHKCHVNDDILNKRHSNKKLMMSCLSPRMNLSIQPFSEDQTIKPRKSTKRKKKSIKDTNHEVAVKISENEIFRKNADVEFTTEDSKDPSVFVTNEKSNLSKDVSVTTLVQFLHNNNNHPSSATQKSNATTSLKNLNYNSGNSEPDDQRQDKETTKQQSNNNSIPNGSIVTMAREMLKKNYFQPPHAKNGMSREMYTLIDPSFESEDENEIRKKNSERWLRLTKSGDQNQSQLDLNPSFKASKISRSSLNTLYTNIGGQDNSGKSSQLVTIPDSGVLSTSKKSRMYISNNLHIRRPCQPIGVVSYLTTKYKHRQQKLCEGGQGYDQTMRNVVKHLHDSWLEQSQCDVAIITDDGEIMAHQAVLSSFSPSLSALFKANKPHSENDMNSDLPHPTLMINMSEFSKDVIADALHFLYTTDIKLDVTNVSHFVLVARRLELPVLSKVCDDYLLNSCNLDSLLLHYLIANNCELSDIATNLETRIAQNFEDLWMKKHLVKLSRSLMMGLLNHPNLSVSEINKLHAVAKWLEYNKPERIKYVCDLMKLVDFEKIEINSLLSTVKNLDWMFTNEAMRTKMLDAYKTSVNTDNNTYPVRNQSHNSDSKCTVGRNSAMRSQEKDSKTIPLEDLFHPLNSPLFSAAYPKNDVCKNKINTQHLERGECKSHCDSPSKGCKERHVTSKQSTKQKDQLMRTKPNQSPLHDNEELTRKKALAAMTSFPAVANQKDLRRRQNSRESEGKKCQRQISSAKHQSQGTSPLRSSSQLHHHHHHHPHRTHHQNHLVSVGTSPSPRHRRQGRSDDNGDVTDDGVDVDDGNDDNDDGNNNDDDDDEYINDLKCQGTVSLFLPNYRPPPFKKYQLTNSTNDKYVEI